MEEVRSLLKDWTHPREHSMHVAQEENSSTRASPRDSRHMVMEEEAGSSVLLRLRSCLDGASAILPGYLVERIYHA